MSSAGITQPKPARIRDLFYSWPFQQLPHPAWGKQQQDQPLHIPADPNPPPQGQAGVWLWDFCSLGQEELKFPQGWGWEPWQKALPYAGMGERRKKGKKKVLKK